MTYRVKFYFYSAISPVDVTMYDREENMGEMCNYLTRTGFKSFIDGEGQAVIVNLQNVSKIEVEEVR